MRYSLDTSALLDGRTRYYPPDVFPDLWDKFENLVSDGGIKATQLVRHELEKKDDDVLEWVKNLDLFIDVDNEIQQIVKDILSQYPKLVAEGGQRSFGDPFVIALAKQHGCAVVTSEKGGSENSPKIPYVCQSIGIECITMLDLIRREKWKF
jgi:predicted DNA-binding protein (UPF0278 family)